MTVSIQPSSCVVGEGCGRKGGAAFYRTAWGNLKGVLVLQVIKPFFFSFGVWCSRKDIGHIEMVALFAVLLGETGAQGTHIRMASFCPVFKSSRYPSLPLKLSVVLGWFASQIDNLFGRFLIPLV